MAFMRKKSRVSGEIPTSAMADIAFLLLIFFLVTTVFDEEKGLQVVLPDAQSEIAVSQENLLHLTIQPTGTVLVQRGASPEVQTVSVSQIEAIWRAEAANNENLIAAVQTHPEAPHRHMIAVLDQLQLANADRISLQLLEE